MTRDLSHEFDAGPSAHEHAHRALDAYTAARAPGTRVVMQASGAKKTPPQHRLWWRLMGLAALALNESGHATPSGRPVLKDDLHLWAKWQILPVAVQQAEEATDSPEEWESVVYAPGFAPVVTRTTTRLSKYAFTLLIDGFLSSDLIAPLGLDVDGIRSEAGAVRSGRVDEPDHLRSVAVPAELMEATPEAHAEAEAVLPSGGVWPTPHPTFADLA